MCFPSATFISLFLLPTWGVARRCSQKCSTVRSWSRCRAPPCWPSALCSFLRRIFFSCAVSAAIAGDAPLNVRQAGSGQANASGAAGNNDAAANQTSAGGDASRQANSATPQPQQSQQQANGVVGGQAVSAQHPSSHQSTVVKSDMKPQARFEIQPGPPLGKGHFAVVKKALDLVTGHMCAVKIIDKKEMVKSSSSVVKQEIEILKAVGSHPNIVQLIDHWEDATKHYLVLELCEGGDLFSQIVEHGKYTEADAVRCCKQLANALKHIHSCGITHRSVTPWRRKKNTAALHAHTRGEGNDA